MSVYQRLFQNLARYASPSNHACVSCANIFADLQEAMDEPFLVTNIAPQVRTSSIDIVYDTRLLWRITSKSMISDSAHVEHFCRRLTTAFSDTYVSTLTLYLPKQERDVK